MIGTTETVKRPRRADAQRNYERLLAVTREAVSEQGSEVALEEIARRAGVGIGTLYRHFPTRQDLLEAAFLDEANQLRTEAERLIDDPSPLEALLSWLRLQLTFGARGRSMGAAVMSAKHQEGSEIQVACQQMRDAGNELLPRAQASGQVRPEVELGDVLRMLHGIVLVDENSPEDPERVDRMFDILQAGLSMPGEGFPRAGN